MVIFSETFTKRLRLKTATTDNPEDRHVFVSHNEMNSFRFISKLFYDDKHKNLLTSISKAPKLSSIPRSLLFISLFSKCSEVKCNVVALGFHVRISLLYFSIELLVNGT